MENGNMSRIFTAFSQSASHFEDFINEMNSYKNPEDDFDFTSRKEA
jgi:hypothetical protein